MYDWIFCPKKPVRIEPVHVKRPEQKLVAVPGYPEITIPEQEFDDIYTAIGEYLEKLQDAVDPGSPFVSCIVKLKDKNDFTYILFYKSYGEDYGDYSCDWDFDEGQGPFYIVSIVPTHIANTLAQYFANDYGDIGICPDKDELPRIITEEDLK